MGDNFTLRPNDMPTNLLLTASVKSILLAALFRTVDVERMIRNRLFKAFPKGTAVDSSLGLESE